MIREIRYYERGCGIHVLESTFQGQGPLPPGGNALLQRLLSLCLELVNDLVSIIPGIELLISGIVMDHGMTSWPPGKEQVGQILLDDSAPWVIDTGDAMQAMATRTIDHVKNPTQEERSFGILASTWSVP